MKFFNGGDKRKQFLTKIAEALYTQAPNGVERENLLATIQGSHHHHQISGMSIEGKNLKKMGLRDNLDIEHRWVIPVIEQCQQTWKQTEHKVPFDLLDPDSGKSLQDLVEAIGEVERRQFLPGGETRKG